LKTADAKRNGVSEINFTSTSKLKKSVTPEGVEWEGTPFTLFISFMIENECATCSF